MILDPYLYEKISRRRAKYGESTSMDSVLNLMRNSTEIHKGRDFKSSRNISQYVEHMRKSVKLSAGGSVVKVENKLSGDDPFNGVSGYIPPLSNVGRRYIRAGSSQSTSYYQDTTSSHIKNAFLPALDKTSTSNNNNSFSSSPPHLLKSLSRPSSKLGNTLPLDVNRNLHSSLKNRTYNELFNNTHKLSSTKSSSTKYTPPLSDTSIQVLNKVKLIKKDLVPLGYPYNTLSKYSATLQVKMLPSKEVEEITSSNLISKIKVEIYSISEVDNVKKEIIKSFDVDISPRKQSVKLKEDSFEASQSDGVSKIEVKVFPIMAVNETKKKQEVLKPSFIIVPPVPVILPVKKPASETSKEKIEDDHGETDLQETELETLQQ
jgi:hypothetical protein